MAQMTTSGAGSRGGDGFLVSILIMGVLAVALLAVGYFRGKGEHIEGLKRTKDMLIGVLPLLILALIAASMVQVLVPQRTVSRFVGKESGLRGIVIACVAGAFTPGGPYASFPIAVGLLRTGAGIGVAVAYLTAWALWGVGKLPLEYGILGLRFTLMHIACTVVFPPAAGLIARFLFE